MSAAPAGWYTDPENPAAVRYWDGTAWTEQRSTAQEHPPAPVAAHVMYGPASLSDVYSLQSLDLLTPEQRERFSAHRLTTFPTWLVIVLHYLTFGLFTLIYQGLHFSKIPHAKDDDFDSGKGIGFMFIPFFNLYWVFRFVHSLIDRVNFQMRLHGQQPRASRGLGTTSCIFQVIPYVGFVFSYLIFTPIVAGQVQSSVNWLAKEREGQMFSRPRPPIPPPTAPAPATPPPPPPPPTSP